MGLFKSLGYSKTSRMYLFFLICIFVRLIPVYLIKHYRNVKEVFVPLMCIVAIAFLMNTKRFFSNSKEWWYSGIHAVFAFLILAYAIFSKDTEILMILFISDILFGITTALVKQPFKVY